MTSTATATTCAAPAPGAGVGAGGGRVRAGDRLAAGLSAAREGVGAAAGVTPSSLSNTDLSAAAVELAALRSQLEALSMAVLAEAHDRGRAGPVGEAADTGAATWLARLTGDPAEVLRGGLHTARLLQNTYHHTRAALESGALRLTQAKVIVRAAERAARRLVAAGVTPEQISAAEEALVATATGHGARSSRPMSATRLRGEARRVLTGLLPTREQAKAAESEDVADDEADAAHECYLTLGDRGDGTWKGSFVLPDLHARLLQAALEHLTAPRRLARDPQGRPVLDESADGTGATRSYADRLGSAFCELLEHLPTEGLSETGIGLLITLDLETLRTGLGTATLDNGAPLSAAAVRRLACTAGHVPVVLGGDSSPVDVGRARRLYDRHQRHALHAVHDSCAITGCTRPLAWCELHHLTRWSEGGATDLSNAIPLCGYHHRAAHDPGYDLLHHRGRHYRLRRRRR